MNADLQKWKSIAVKKKSRHTGTPIPRDPLHFLRTRILVATPDTRDSDESYLMRASKEELQMLCKEFHLEYLPKDRKIDLVGYLLTNGPFFEKVRF